MNIISENKYLIFFIGWYIYNYGPPRILIYYILRAYYFSQNVFNNLNKVIHPDYWKEEQQNTVVQTDNIQKKTEEEPKLPPKYEDKYLENIRKLNKEWEFTEEEITEESELVDSFFSGSKENIAIRIEELIKMCSDLERDIEEDTDEVRVESNNEEQEEPYETTVEERNNERRQQINEMTDELNNIKLLIETKDGLNELMNKAKENARKFIVNKRIDKLDNCHVMEKTPQGNVLMIYDKSRESFKYYSDSTIPYRYLEVVARKYVKMFNCRPLFVDMEEELKLFEEKWEKEQEQKKIKEEQQKMAAEETFKIVKPVEEKKKNVFAKFKSYNKDAGGKMNMAAPPKNSIPNKFSSEVKEDEKILLKEKANRYTYEGKFANFNFLKVPEKKTCNKKLGLTFADFKKMQQNK